MKTILKQSMMAFAALALLFSASCSKDDDNPSPEEENDNEVITKVELSFKETGTENEKVFTWSDPDGDGGNAPVIQTIALDANKSYSVSIKLLDEVNDEDVTEEIEEEDIDHRFYFTPSEGSNITVNNLNNDQNGVTLGITSTWTAGAAAEGNVHIVLRHYAEGGKQQSDLVNDSKSSTDAEIEFPSKVQ